MYRYLAEGKCSEAYRKESDPQKADEIIYKAATDLMYNQGYPLTGKVLEKNKQRSHNTTLELIDAWYSQGEQFRNAGFSEFDPEPYQDLFERLNRERKTKVFVPVRVDPETGTGFYIVGRDHYVEFPYRNRRQACGIGILTDWISDFESAQEDREEDIHLSLTIGSLEDPMDFPNIVEANSWFINRLYRDKKERFGFFRECNGKLPSGSDHFFGRYFADQEGAGDEFEKITEDDWEDAREDFLSGTEA